MALAIPQYNSATGSAVTSLACAFASAVTTGNLIVVCIRQSTTSQTCTVTDNHSNVYTQAVSQQQTADGHTVRIYYAKNVTGGTTTVTATFSASNNHPWIFIAEVSGADTTSPLDKTVGAQANGYQIDTGYTAATTANDELIFSVLGLPSSYTGVVSAGDGYYLIAQDPTAGLSRAAAETATAATQQAYHATYLLDNGTNWSACLATFKPASTVGAPTITTTSLAAGTQGTAYSQTLAASGGTAPLSWSVTIGALPTGLNLTAGTGVIAGTPTVSGTYNFTVQVADSASPVRTATKAFSILINAPGGGGYAVTRDTVGRVPWYYNTATGKWVHYDDPTSIAEKIQYIKNSNIGGWFIWALNLDYTSGATPEMPLMEKVVEAVGITPPPPPPPSGNVWSIGYFQPWSIGSYTVNDINWNALTHICVVCASPLASGALDTGSYTGFGYTTSIVTAAHAHGKKALLDIYAMPAYSGSWAAVTNGNRSALVANIVALVKDNGYDGVTLNWEGFNKNDAAQVAGHQALAAELRAQLPSPTYLLMEAAVPDDWQYWQQTASHQHLDRVCAMTYDGAGAWDGESWFHSALYSDAPPNDGHWSWELTRSRFLALGMPASRLTMGIAFFGYTWTNCTAPRQTPTTNMVVNQGPNYSTIRGLLSGVTVHRDATTKVPWYTTGGAWINYDDAISIADKAAYVNAQGLGGWIIWALNLDFTSGASPACPLAAAVATALAGSGTPWDGTFHPTGIASGEAFGSASVAKQGSGANFWSMGYCAPWSADAYVDNTNSTVYWDGLTHIIHVCASPNANGTLDTSTGATRFYEAINGGIIAGAHNRGKKVLLDIFSQAFQNGFASAASATYRQALIDNIMTLLTTHGYDGVEIDWEHPTFNPSVNGADMTALLQGLRARLDAWAPGKILAVACDVTHSAYWATTTGFVDAYLLMSYDEPYVGESYTWFQSGTNAPDDMVWSYDLVLRRWAAAGVPYNKMVMGIPFYGWQWTGCSAPGPGNQGTSKSQVQNCYTIRTKLQSGTVVWDVTAQNDWVNSGGFFDAPTERGVAAKVRWAMGKNILGTMIWAISMDYFPGEATPSPLLKAIGDVIGVTPPANLTVTPSGIGSGEAFGAPVTASDIIIGWAGNIASGEVFGIPAASPPAFFVYPTGVDFGSALGTPTLTLASLPVSLYPWGIGSTEVFGYPFVQPDITPSTIYASGIASGERFGNCTVQPDLLPVGIYTLYINGVVCNDWLMKPSIRRSASIGSGSRTTCSFTLTSKPGLAALRPLVDDEVVIYEFSGGQNKRFFAGSVESVEEQRYGKSLYSQVRVQCTDYGIICDRRIIGKYYLAEGGYAENTINDIVQTALAGTGISYVHTSAPNTYLGEQVFSYVTVTEALNQICDKINCDWRIDYWKILKVFPRNEGYGPAPYTITDANAHALAGLVVRTNRTQRVNRQGAKTSNIQSYWVDNFTAASVHHTGIQWIFFATYPLDTPPYVFRNGVICDVISLEELGQSGSAWQFYYTDRLVVGKQDSVVLGDNIQIVYPSALPYIYWVEDPTDIALHGRFERVEDVRDAQDVDALIAVADGLLARSLEAPTEMEFTSLDGGWEPGQLVQVNLTLPAINETLLIESVDSEEMENALCCQNRIKASNNSLPRANRADTFFNRLIQNINIPNIDEIDVQVDAATGVIIPTGAPNAPSSPTVSIADGSTPGLYKIHTAWNPASPAGSEIGFERAIQFYADAQATQPVSGWTPLVSKSLSVTSDDSEGWPRPVSSSQFVRFRIRSYDRMSNYSSWIMSMLPLPEIAPEVPGVVTEPYAITLTPDLSKARTLVFTATGPFNIAAPIATGRSLVEGDWVELRLIQDSVGGHAPGWDSIYRGLTNKDIDVRPYTWTSLMFRFDGVQWLLAGYLIGE